MADLDKNPSHLVGQRVTLVGIARDAHQGAVVLLSDDTPVYLRGVFAWDDDWDRKRVRVTGLLKKRKLAPDPTTNAKGEVSHGMYGESLVIEEPTWEEVT